MSAISKDFKLEDLLKDIPAEQLDRLCHDAHLLELSQSLTDWQAVSPFLGLGEADEEAIQVRSNTLQRQRIDVLRFWQQKAGTQSTYRYVRNIFLLNLTCNLLQMGLVTPTLIC